MLYAQNAAQKATSSPWCYEGRTTNIDLPNRDAGAYNHKLGSNIDLRTKLDHPTIKFVRPRALVAEQHVHDTGQVLAASWWRRRFRRFG
jgi:hypothetical protein